MGVLKNYTVDFVLSIWKYFLIGTFTIHNRILRGMDIIYGEALASEVELVWCCM